MDSEEQKLHPWHGLGLTEPDTEEDEEAISRRMAEELKKALEEVSAPYQATEVLPEQWSLEEKKPSVQENPTNPKKLVESKKQADSENSSEPKKSAVEKPRKQAEPEKIVKPGRIGEPEKKGKAAESERQERPGRLVGAERLAAADPPSKRKRPENTGNRRAGGKAGKKTGKSRKWPWILLVLFAGGLTAYIAVAVHYSEYFYDNTLIYGIDCSGTTAEEAKELVSERLGEYVLSVEERGGETETITADDIGLTYVDNGAIDQLLRAQRAYIWPLMIKKEHTALTSVTFSYDQDSAEAALDALNCMDESLVTAPEDAYIEVTDDGFIIVSEVEGNTLDYEKTLEIVLEALDAGVESISLEEKGCYLTPEIYEDDEELNSDLEELNALASAYITFDFGDREEVVSAPVIQEWITTAVDGSFVIDEFAVEDYVEELAEKYDTYEKEHEFTTTGGETLTLEGGDYGWEIDQESTLIELLNALEDGYQGTMEPVYTHTAMSRDTNDIGDTYVEICISLQEMWCYADGELVVDTPVVTGNPNKGNATPSNGVWAIDGKRRNATLRGEGYATPVSYWMPFNGNVGIHDLTSRSAFGGTIYLTNGSHGCVNTPYTAAETIFNTVSVGTPVVVYD